MQIIGAKKGQQASKPYIMPDNMQSGNEVGIVYGLGEGEILGLVDGGKSIYLDGTPLINDNGGENFAGVIWEMRHGTIDQEHLHGFPAVENETGVNVELRHDRPFVRQIRNTKLSAVVIRLGFGAIFTAKDNGDRVGHTIEYAVDVQTDGGVWRELLATKFAGKASQGYKRSHRIDLPTAKSNWTIRVRRITANKDSEMIGDRMTIDALTEVLDAKLRYPCTALIGLRFNAESFNNIPKFAAECHGMIIQVPTNYDPVSRTYSGLWDGTFKLAYSNNPAWIYYDLCTARRYALGDRLIGHLDKWSLYRVAQYCDEMVDDGRGGREPRYACNVYLQQREDAYKILQNIAGIFHALTYWDGEQIIVDADLPKDVLYTFSRANIIGDFEYSGTANYARHTQIKVAWDDPDNEYKTTYEIVPDLQAIAKYGVKTLDMSAFGCTSQAQAIRLGKWALLSEALETQTVTFSVGLDGYLPHVGSVIAVSDHVLAGRDNGGRVQAIDGNVITLDRVITKSLASGDLLMINGNDGVAETRTITAINGNKITVQTAFERAEVDAVWAMDSADLQTLKLRVMSIVQSEPAKFTITGVEYNPDKFVAAEIDIRAQPKPVSVIPTAVISAPETVTISQSVRVEQGVSITKLSIDWSQVIGAVAYRVEWRTDDNAWIALPKTASQTIDIDNVYSGNYQARVRAIDAFDNESLATSSQITAITGKVGKPPRLARLTATGKLFGMDLTWVFNAGSADTNYTEIQVSPDGRSNIATLGTFAYPTDKHTINGLQGNLTQFYRARIVDKLGNTSDWTAWTSGTTEAQAEKVLELLTGQITASQLHQDLTAPINKINGIETGLASARFDINKAITDIGTERNRISQAIADIDVLRLSDNAKTLELANLTQTVGGHTGSIRDLAVTTGELSQRYTQLKTASDNANSEITAIKQTQSGQATQLDTLNSRFDSLSVGGRNLLLGSGNSRTMGYSTSYLIANADLLAVGDDVVVTIWGELGADRQQFAVYNTHGYGELATLSQVATGVYQAKFKWRHHTTTGEQNRSLAVYVYHQSATSQSRIDRIKLEKGNIATDWTPAPEDVDAQFVQTSASINTLQQTVTNADNALSQRIDTLDASYKSADRALNSSITAEQTARANADNALSQRITAFDSAYKSADKALSARVATAEQSASDAQQAIAQTQQTLTAKIDSLSVGGRNLLLGSGNSRTMGYSTSYLIANADLLAVGDDVVVTIWGELGADRQQFAVYNTHGYGELAKLSQVAQGVYQAKFKWRHHTTTGEQNRSLAIYAYPGTSASQSRIDRIKLERSTIATDWTPAPEDVDSANQAALEQISQVKATANGLSAQYTVKIDNGGRVSGYGLASGAGGISDFAVVADKFYIAPPSGGKGTVPFVVRTTPTTINGVSVPAGVYLSDGYIQNGTITNAKIANGAITTAKIGNAQIGNAQIANGAITTAKIGDAQITGAKIGNAQVDTLQIAGEAVIVPRLQYSPSFEFRTIDREEVINSVTIDAKGGAVSISFGFDGLSFRARNLRSNDGVVILRIKRGGTVLRQKEFTINVNTEGTYDVGSGEYGQVIFLTFLDTPPAGNQTYTVTLESRRLNDGIGYPTPSASPVIIKERTLHIMGVKR